MSRLLKDITGMRFGRLIALSIAGRDTFGRVTWFCQCDCGKKITVFSSNLVRGNTKSCGCLREEKRLGNDYNFKHGHSKCARDNHGVPTNEYVSWMTMRQRCLNPNHHKYPIYGGRGITICKRWSLFENFLADMGERPKGMTLHRTKNSENYEPSNCEWADYYTQNQNREFGKKQSQVQT